MANVHTDTASQVRAVLTDVAGACAHIQDRLGPLTPRLAAAWPGTSGTRATQNYSQLGANAAGQGRYVQSLADQTQSLVVVAQYLDLCAETVGATRLVSAMYQPATLEIGEAAEWGAAVAADAGGVRRVSRPACPSPRRPRRC